ncbi:MAG: Tim44 domain-containing protein, partial [Thermodesulfovibrionales bacterium]
NQTRYEGAASPSTPSYITDDVAVGLSHIRQLDALFDDKRFKELVTDMFFKVQSAWMARNMDNIKHLLTQEIYSIMKEDTDRMRREGRINRLENIAIRNVEITEAWQEEGRDYITVEFNANVLDYVTDETGKVLEGSNVEPVKFVEYWTFTRSAGPNQWQLSAIQQG